MKYRLFLIMATAVVLGSTLSCSQNEVVTNDGDQKDPISFNVNVGTLPAPDVTTRGYTTTSAETGYTFSGGEYMAVGLTHPSGSEVIKQYSVGAGSSGNNALTYQKESDGTTTGYTFNWFSTSENVTIRAWSDGKTTTASTPVADPDGQPFTVETTQTGDVKELLYSPATSYAYTTSAINIPLYHQLARIVVTIVRANTSTPISSVTIGHNSTGNRVPIIGTFHKPTGTGVNYGTWSVTSEATQPTHWGVITPKEETAGSVYSAVVIPGGATEYPANTRLFNITIGSEVFAYKIPTGGLTLEAGKQYNYTITVENMGITVTSSIASWGYDAGGSQVNADVSNNKAVEIGRPKLPIEYVIGTHNLATATTMAADDDPRNSGYFYWGSSISARSTQMQNFVNGTVSGLENYHLPSILEWMSIVPAYWPTSVATSVVDIDGNTEERVTWQNGEHLNMKETVAWGVTNNNGVYSYDVKRRFSNDYNCPNDDTHRYIGYGLRFKELDGKNGRYTCAYRYEYIIPDNNNNLDRKLVVKVKYVGYDQSVTITTISKEDWWGTTSDFELTLPSCGHKQMTSANYAAGDYPDNASVLGSGCYWAAEGGKEGKCYCVIFHGSGLYGDYLYEYQYSFSVRLFHNAE